MHDLPYETNNESRFKHIDSYSKKKKYIDSYNTKWKKYIDSYSKKKVHRFLQYKMKEKNDWCAHCKQKKKLRFLQRFFAKILTIRNERRKMIDVHTVNKNKKQKKWDFCRYSLQWIYVYS